MSDYSGVSRGTLLRIIEDQSIVIKCANAFLAEYIANQDDVKIMERAQHLAVCFNDLDIKESNRNG